MKFPTFAIIGELTSKPFGDTRQMYSRLGEAAGRVCVETSQTTQATHYDIEYCNLTR